MNMIVSIFALLFSFRVSSTEVALTFDDAPMRDMGVYTGDERTQKLIKVLQKYKIQTVFFSSTSGFTRYNGLERMKAYDQAGHFIANHTHTHPNYDKTSTQDYIADFDKAHNLLAEFKNFKPWFRYPMLRHGNTLAKRDAMRAHLDKMKYKNGYVTLDIQDWFMADLVNKAIDKGKSVNEKKLCRAYSEMIWESMLYYDGKASELLKRNPKHMLLLHENDLAALCLEALIIKITSNGWKIISPEAAIQDEIYKKRPNTLFNNNGQIAALYHESKGVKIHDPWSYPWEDGKLIRDEFHKREVFENR